jgi:hypothetical protein
MSWRAGLLVWLESWGMGVGRRWEWGGDGSGEEMEWGGRTALCLDSQDSEPPHSPRPSREEKGKAHSEMAP